MTLTEQVYAQAALLAGSLDEAHTELLKTLCFSSATALSARLKPSLTPEDCRADFVAAASLFALSAMNEAQEAGGPEEFKAGDLTVRCRGKDAASRVLYNQAELMIIPYLKDSFCFAGV